MCVSRTRMAADVGCRARVQQTQPAELARELASACTEDLRHHPRTAAPGLMTRQSCLTEALGQVMHRETARWSKRGADASRDEAPLPCHCARAGVACACAAATPRGAEAACVASARLRGYPQITCGLRCQVLF